MNRASRASSRSLLVTVVLVCVVVLVGCVSSARPGGRLPSGVASVSPVPSVVVPTVPADVPLTGPNLLSPGEKPPVMPVAALHHDAAGATAFAEFFIKTLDWGYATTSSAYMRHYFEPSCDRCIILANTLDDTRRDNVHFEGQRMAIKAKAATEASDMHGAEQIIDITSSIGSAKAVDAKGDIKNADEADPAHVESVFLGWTGVAWSVIYMEGHNGR